MVPGVPCAVGRSGCLARIEGVADRAVADRVHVHLEAARVEGDHRLDQLVAIQVADPGLLGLVAGRVAVGAEHRAGVVLEHAVAHDLHGRRMEPADGAAIPPRDELTHLLDAAVPVPPERPDHPGGELAALGERAVRLLRGRRDPGVLPPGDAEGVEMLLREQDRPLPLLLWRRGEVGIRERVGGALVQGAGRLAGRGIALDPPVPRVGGLARDVAGLQGLRVHPRSVDVSVQQEDRPVGNDVVEQLLRRRAAREVGHQPATAEDPGLFGVGLRVGGDRVSVGVHARAGRGARRAAGTGRRTARGDGSPGRPGAPSVRGGGGAPSRSGTAPSRPVPCPPRRSGRRGRRRPLPTGAPRPSWRRRRR